jgi:hypothetical protein
MVVVLTRRIRTPRHCTSHRQAERRLIRKALAVFPRCYSPPPTRVSMENKAVWLDGPGKTPRVASAPTPEPGPGELLLKVGTHRPLRSYDFCVFVHMRRELNMIPQVKAVAVQPGEWKIQAGLIPVPLTYPAIIGRMQRGDPNPGNRVDF